MRLFMDIRVLGQQYESYGNYFRGFSPHTIRRYQNCLDLFQRETGVIEVEQVTSEMIRTWFFKGRTIRGWSATTFLTYYRTLLTFFKWCIRERHITNNPVADLGRPRKEKKLPRRLTKQEALRLLEVVYNYPYRHPYLRFRNHALFATFIFAGLRRQEAVNLKLTDVDLENSKFAPVQSGVAGDITAGLPLGTWSEELAQRLIAKNEVIWNEIGIPAAEREERRKVWTELYRRHIESGD